MVCHTLKIQCIMKVKAVLSHNSKRQQVILISAIAFVTDKN